MSLCVTVNMQLVLPLVKKVVHIPEPNSGTRERKIVFFYTSTKVKNTTASHNLYALKPSGSNRAYLTSVTETMVSLMLRRCFARLIDDIGRSANERDDMFVEGI